MIKYNIKKVFRKRTDITKQPTPINGVDENKTFYKDVPPQFIGTSGQTFKRLNELEFIIQQQNETIANLQQKINELLTSGNPNAKYVYDTSVGEYKNVKDIQIKESINTIAVQVPDTPGVYVTMDKFRVAYATTAETSNVTTNIMYQGVNAQLDNILMDFISDAYLKRALEQSTNFDEFKAYVLNSLIK